MSLSESIPSSLVLTFRGLLEEQCQLRVQSGKFVVTPLDDTTLIDSQKKGGKFHACLLAELIHGVSHFDAHVCVTVRHTF